MPTNKVILLYYYFIFSERYLQLELSNSLWHPICQQINLIQFTVNKFTVTVVYIYVQNLHAWLVWLLTVTFASQNGNNQSFGILHFFSSKYRTKKEQIRTLNFDLTLGLTIFLKKKIITCKHSSAYLSTHLPAYLSVCLSVHLSVCLSVYLSVSLSICQSLCQYSRYLWQSIYCTCAQM